MPRQVMSSTLDRANDFPRLNGSNFPVWNARVRAALDGRGLLGFIDQEDYDGDSEPSPDTSDDEALDASPPKVPRPTSPTPSEQLLSDTGTLPLGSEEDADPLDSAAQPKAPASSSDAASDSSSGNSSAALSQDGKAAPPKATAKPPPIKSFADTKRDKERRRAMLRAQAKKSRAKHRAAKKRAARKPSSHQRRRMERKTRSFLIDTIDDAHVLLVEGCTSAFAIYQKLRDRYEGSTAHGDPYYINHYLMTIKYEEGTDLMGFFLEFERALKGAAEATGIVMTDEQKSLYLYHAMPSSWKPDLAIWKGSKKFIPYTDLKNNIERKVLDDYAKRKYVIAKGSPESTLTASETALKAVSNPVAPRQESSRQQVSCSYCQRANHVIRDCRVLQKHLRTGTVKEGTVLPANFAIIDRKPRDDGNAFPAKHPRQNRQDDRQRPGTSHADNGYKAPDIYDRFGNPVSFHDLQRQLKSRGRESGLIAFTTSVSPAIGLSATTIPPLDPIWTVDSGCTRHAAYQESWFKEIRPYAGSIMVGGKQQLPIHGIGDVVLHVSDTTGVQRELELRDVLYIPDMQFNLLSIAQLLKIGIRVVFNSLRQCTFFVGKNFKMHVHLSPDMDLFQVKAQAPPPKPLKALVAEPTADDNPAQALVAQPDNV